MLKRVTTDFEDFLCPPVFLSGKMQLKVSRIMKDKCHGLTSLTTQSNEDVKKRYLM